MAKRKAKLAVESNVPVEDTSDFEPLAIEDTLAGQWRGTYAPLWRAQLDAGTGTFADVQIAVERLIEEVVRGTFGAGGDLALEWREGEDGNWYAYGSDGSPQETHLPLARIERITP